MAMDPEIKAKWLAALRSGERQQASKVLRTKDDRFCCLGVLCDLVAPDAWDLRGNLYQMSGRRSMPPDYICKKTGVFGHEADFLANMNDTGSSFAQIANYIEENL